MKFLIKNQNGFTLIELLIALVIFAVGILGVATMQITSIQGNSKGRQISEASNVGAGQIERILSLPYDSHNNNLDDDGDGAIDENDEQFIDGAGTNDGVAGLDDVPANNTDGAADSDGDGVNDIFWNVAVDHPLSNTKTIKFFIDPPGSGRNIEMTYVKAEAIK